MASEFSIQVQGAQPVLQVLAQLRGRLENMGPAWQEVGDELTARADRRFETKTDPAGKAWAPWKPATRRLRAKEGRGTLLEYTGLLRASLNALATRDHLVLGLGQAYGPYTETGTRKMARRSVFLGQVAPQPQLGEQDSRAVLEILMDHLSGGARG